MLGSAIGAGLSVVHVMEIENLRPERADTCGGTVVFGGYKFFSPTTSPLQRRYTITNNFSSSQQCECVRWLNNVPRPIRRWLFRAFRFAFLSSDNPRFSWIACRAPGYFASRSLSAQSSTRRPGYFFFVCVGGSRQSEHPQSRLQYSCASENIRHNYVLRRNMC